MQIISQNKKNPNSILALAKASQTIVYECLVKLDGKIRREVV